MWLENCTHRNHRFIKSATHGAVESMEASATRLSREAPLAIDTGMSGLLVAGDWHVLRCVYRFWGHSL